MRLPLLFAAVLGTILGGALFVALQDSAAQTPGGKCLRFRDLQSLTKVDDKTAVAHTRSAQKFLVTFRHGCRQLGEAANPYTVRLHSEAECFDRDDVLVFRYGGACFIESVQPAPAT